MIIRGFQRFVPYVFGVLISILCLEARADYIATIIPTVTGPDTTGLYTYAYQINNAGPDSVLLFSLFNLDGFTAGSITAPDLDGNPNTVEWDFFSDPSSITWFSTAASSDIRAGTSLGGFSFTSGGGPLPTPFETFGSDPTTGIPTVSHDGVTVGPAVPEPQSVILLGVGMLFVLACIQRQMRPSAGSKYR